MKTPNYSDDVSAPLIVATTAPATRMEDTWTCPMCTLFNPNSAHTCDACCFPKSQIEPSPFSSVESSHQPIVPVHMVKEIDGNQGGDYYYDRDDVKIEMIESEEDPFAKTRRRRRRRRLRMLGGATAGAVVGGAVFCGPWGAVVGGVAGGAGARYLSKRGERKKDVRLAMNHMTTATVH